ncbi:mitochondrial carrier domain-containing protein [Pavlovales sp. CCMP2436]|nr:mitochondrial carrier domain-containing protein [Pavlovales sp. CCMP2436]
MSLVDTASGLAGACACTYTGLPFDIAKVRIQSGQYQYAGVIDCLYKVGEKEGVRGWWRGLMPALSSSMAENMTGVTVQRAIRRQLSPHAPDARLPVTTELAAGALTGFCTSIVMNPFEVIKTRIQMSNLAEAERPSLFGALHSVARSEGVNGLFRGLTALWARDIPFNAFFFGTYETLTTVMLRKSGLASRDDLPSYKICLAGGLAGVVGWTCVLPFDVVKTRLQASVGPQGRTDISGAIMQIVQREGVAGLYRGWTAAVCRAFPANAAMFLAVETSQRILRQMLNDKDHVR